MYYYYKSTINLYFTGMFYFTIGNLSPMYRSQLSNIHLVAIAKTGHIDTYGMDAVLKPFVDDLKKLVHILYTELVTIMCLIPYIGTRI